jgi:hypothetical protein
VRKYYFEILALVLIGGSLAFFVECVSFVGRRDYVAAFLMLLVGVSMMHVGAELARLALVERE